MIYKFIKNCRGVFFASLFAVQLMVFNFCNAAGVSENIDEHVAAFNENAGFSNAYSVGGILALVIKGFLGLLGIIFLILILTAGYNWMISAGDEEKIKKAKDTILRAVIGLIIIVGAYAITYFVFKNLGGVGGTGGAGGLGGSPK